MRSRLISAALIPLTIAPFAAGTLHPTWDAIFCATILIHTHIGFEYVFLPDPRAMSLLSGSAVPPPPHFTMLTSLRYRSIIIDYIPVKEYPRARWIFMQGLKVATLAVAVGLYEFETNDVGLTEAVKRIWMA